MSGFLVGAYATCPSAGDWKANETAFYEGLAAIPQMGGLEVSFDGSLHPHDEEWFLGLLKAQPAWDCILTSIGGTLGHLSRNRHFGLASDDEQGRAQAVAFEREKLLAVGRLNSTRPGRVLAVELHRFATMTTAARTATDREHIT
jgi:hypothetical protein